MMHYEVAMGIGCNIPEYSHMFLLLKLQRDSNDVNYDAFNIPHISLRDMSPCTDY